MNFRLANYHTVYNSTVDDQVVTKDLCSHACFSTLYSYLSKNGNTHTKRKVELTIQVCMDEEYIQKNLNNMCFLTDDEFQYFTSELKKIFDIESAYIRKDNYIEYTAKGNLHSVEVKMLTTLFRYCYEFPYNVFLKDAVILKMNRKFVNINLFNTYNIISASSNNVYVGTGHACISNRQLYCLLNYENLKKQMNLVERCNTVYRNTNKSVIESVDIPKDIKNEYFELANVLSRYVVYYKNYSLLKLQENYIQNV